MPKILKSGDQVNGYEVTLLLNKGAMATAYAAKSNGGKKVFLKQYKSPTITVPWYKGYVSYQSELKRRIESTRAKEYCYQIIDFFEAEYGHRCYFQVFEFIEKGHDLEKTLDQIRVRPNSISWEQRVLLGKVLITCLHAIHDAKVIHSDLKPPNIQLYTDETIASKYRLKLIDMDYSVLADRKAPWDGHQGYVGSPGYFSPEHLAGRSPTTASDVFTCGLILYELLAQGHPYRFDDPEKYTSAVQGYRTTPPRLAGKMPPPADDAQVMEFLYRCLSPNPAHRPTARDVNLAFNGRVGTPASGSHSDPPKSPGPTTKSSDVSRSAQLSHLELVSDSGRTLRFGIRTEVGRDLCKTLGEDSKFWSSAQCILEKDGSENWVVAPCPDTTNETLLNGKAVLKPTALSDGDVLAVGRESKGIVKLPLKVRLA